jgi:SPP1 gp7 family putative phage head morphogenesis protein
MPEPIDLAYAVTLAPKDAIEYFQAKGYAISWNWWEIWQAQHAQAFTVAKAMKLDVLQTLRDTVGEALAEGQTQEQFARLLTPKLKALGWWGWQEHIDTSTGEITRVKLGSPWRLKTIYRTNLQSAYMAGRWKAQAENADAQPYLQYVAVMDAKTRPGHAALNGKVFRIDDPVWNRIYPPNGFNCFPAETAVRADARIGLKTWYAGKMVEMHTRLGHRLTLTANHPVLSGRGWLSARQIQKGDQVLSDTGVGDARLVGIVHHEEPPTLAENLFEALASQGLRVVPMAPHDFHGDASLRKPEIHVAGADRHLVDELQSPSEQLVGQGQFRPADVGFVVNSDRSGRPSQGRPILVDAVVAQNPADVAGAGFQLTCDGALGNQAAAIEGQHPSFQMGVPLPGCFPGGAALPGDSRRVLLERLPLQALGLGAAPNEDVLQAELPLQGATATSGFLSQLLEANAGLVALDEIVEIREFDWAGHVYDFETETGLIVASGVVVHNCRCRTRALSQAQLDARQLQVSEAAPVSREMEIGVDKRTGEIIRKDVGGVRFRHLGKEMEFYPDAGFDYNPGAAKWGGPDLRQYEADLAAQYRAEAAPKPSVTDWKALGLPPAKALRVMEGVSGAPPALLEGADTVDGALDVLREALGVQAGGRRTITTPVGEVVIDDAWLRHIVEKREAARERYANWIVPALEQPTEVWLSPYGEGENRKRFIKLFAEGGKDMLVVVSLSKNDVVWNAIPMPTRSMDNQRNGELLWSSYR